MKKNENVNFFPRMIAFLIDLVIVGFVCSLLSLPFINEDNSEKISNEVNEIVSKAANQEISLDTYFTELVPLIYESERQNGAYTIIMLLVSIFYYIVFQFHTGQTLGKKIFNIKLVSNNGDLTMNQMVFRGLIINSILFSLLTFVFLLFSNSKTFFIADLTLASLYYLILLISSFMIIYRKDHRGLHDIICNTKVVKC